MTDSGTLEVDANKTRGGDVVADRKPSKGESYRWRTFRRLVRGTRARIPACSVVHAFITGDSKSQVQGSSDDGEPKSTAGRSVLEALKGSGFTNVLLTVVRFYGGTNLGTGGLVRAYSDCAKVTLRGLKGEIRSESFGAVVTVEGVVPE